MKNKVYSASEIDFTIDQVPARPEARKLLMCTPEHFDIIDVKNVHMEGNAGKLDKKKAYSEWVNLKRTFERAMAYDILDGVLTIQGAEGCEDMVFTANQSFPWINAKGEKIIILSKMRHDSRKREVPYFKAFYENIGYKTIELKNTQMFEGMGDLIYHTGKRLLYGGYGHRTVKEAYNELVDLLECPIVALELKDERFYHLDTCFVSLGTDAVMIAQEAFTEEGIAALKKLYKRVHYIPVNEAIDNFALNAHTLFNHKTGKKMAVIQQGATFTNEVLRKEGFEVFEVDTTEFMKSGGSVFCMKMMVY
jgi:N-dimethylarginine dimethylaminohydrolase